ncbi:tetratricopeptide repeat protein [Pirellulaceae bacterium SH449]
MKSERQQNQETDLIADKIEVFLVRVKQLLPQIISVIAVAVIGLLAVGFYYSMQNTKLAQAWTALYFTDTTASDLESIAEDFSGTQAELWARQLAGDSHLAKGTESVFTNRDVSDKHFENAVAEYEKVVSRVSEGLLGTRAAWGLAQAEEGLGKRESAATTYKKLTRVTNAEPALVAEAARRSDWLESADGEEFFKWFNENRPTGAALPPSFPGQLPGIPGAPTFDFSSPFPTSPLGSESTAPPLGDIPATEGTATEPPSDGVGSGDATGDGPSGTGEGGGPPPVVPPVTQDPLILGGDGSGGGS